MPSLGPIIERWREITNRIESARKNSPAGAKSAVLVAVAKAHPAESMLPLLSAGHRAFGENKVQEAEAKWPGLRAKFPGIELHLIGSLQSNKAQEALELFDVIETVDRPSLVDALAKERAKASLRCSQFWVQVNIGEEKQKGGVLPLELPSLLAHCKAKGLSITGLMCVPPAEENPAPYFALLHKMGKEHGIHNLSMGMSGDYEVAVRLGATHVRVGTALFGQRD